MIAALKSFLRFLKELLWPSSPTPPKEPEEKPEDPVEPPGELPMMTEEEYLETVSLDPEWAPMVESHRTEVLDLAHEICADLDRGISVNAIIEVIAATDMSTLASEHIVEAAIFAGGPEYIDDLIEYYTLNGRHN